MSVNNAMTKNVSLKAALKPAELKPYTQRSNLIATWLVFFNWALIIAAFTLTALWPTPLVIIISLVLLANRQLGLAILMHECAHYSLFKSRELNRWVGTLLCAAPVIADLNGYRKYHMQHHIDAGTTADPDYPNYKNYPVTKSSMGRKIARDFTGITGLKTLYATLLMNAGLLNYDMSYQSHSAEKKIGFQQGLTNLIKNLALPVTMHLLMWFTLYWLGHGWLYGLWWVSYFTVYMFILRIRNAAEHGAVPDLLDKDPLLHARTTYASWWERLTFSPNYVNYHMEHHLRPSVPCYRLPSFHAYLQQRGLLNHIDVAPGYLHVMRQLTQKPLAPS